MANQQTDLSLATLETLKTAEKRAEKLVEILTAAEFADIGVARYEPYYPDSFAVLDRNFQRTHQARAALAKIREELKRREELCQESPSANPT